MIDREALTAALSAGNFVAITYAKKSGEKTTRIAAPWSKLPESDAPKGARGVKEGNFAYYEVGAKNRFDESAPGDWKSFILDNGEGFAIVSEPESWTGK